jgi:hypothetical protein
MTIALASLQRNFQNLILQADDHVRVAIDGQDAQDIERRLSIYTSAYRLSLHEALASNFPMLQSHVGTDAFSEIAGQYTRDHPSTSVSVRDFGVELPVWLRLHRANEPCLADLARFEWAMNTAFDAPNAPAISSDALAQFGAAEWASLQFGFAPSVQRFSLATNAHELYEDAVQQSSLRVGITLPHPIEWLAWRHDLIARYRSLEAPEAMALDSLRRGATFGEACERLLERYDDETVPSQAAAFLKRWLLDDLVVAVSVTDR